MKRVIRLTLFTLFCLALGTLWVAYDLTLQHLQPPRYPVPDGTMLREYGIEYEEIELTSFDGLRLKGWYTPPKNGAIIIMAHGFGGSRSEDFYLLFAEHGYGIVAWDARAHGESEGKYVTFGYKESYDVETALDFALAQPNVEHIGAWGGSMGGVATILAAARRTEIEAVIVDSPFPSLEDELKDQMPLPILPGMMRFFAEREIGISADDIRPVDVIGKISPRPIFIIQGMADTHIPPDSGQQLYDAAGEPRWLWTQEEPPHMNMYAFYRTRYTKRTTKFFREFLLEQ